MKDYFSSESDKYALYRPNYSKEVFLLIENLLKEKTRAWDCATGNGQVATCLSQFLEEVEATDISRQQIENAILKPNIKYSLQPAENTNFPDEFFDLVTVAQAIHWFDIPKFYQEVRRVLKPGGVIAVLGYALFRSNMETNKIIDNFYHDIIGPYWDEERKYLEEEYKTIPFPFDEIHAPEFQTRVEWSYERLIGYLRTWSAVKHFKRERGEDPVALIENDLTNSFGWKGKVEFPILLRVGKLKREEAFKE